MWAERSAGAEEARLEARIARHTLLLVGTDCSLVALEVVERLAEHHDTVVVVGKEVVVAAAVASDCSGTHSHSSHTKHFARQGDVAAAVQTIVGCIAEQQEVEHGTVALLQPRLHTMQSSLAGRAGWVGAPEAKEVGEGCMSVRVRKDSCSSWTIERCRIQSRAALRDGQTRWSRREMDVTHSERLAYYAEDEIC
jgi:hypothetical protein